MNKQSEALRLADILESWKGAVSNDAAAELRRLHEVNAELVEALENLMLRIKCDVERLHEWSIVEQELAHAAILKATGEQQ